MHFNEIPVLAKFYKHVALNPRCMILQDGQRRIRLLIEKVPAPSHSANEGHDPKKIVELAASCAAVEKSTRIIWACAAATECIVPPMWNDCPDYLDALDYFNGLSDLDFMRVTKEYGITWEKALHLKGR